MGEYCVVLMNYTSADVPETVFCNENTVVPSNREIHNPVVEVTAEHLSDQDSNLYDTVMSLYHGMPLEQTYDWCTVSPSDPELGESVAYRSRGPKEDGVGDLLIS